MSKPKKSFVELLVDHYRSKQIEAYRQSQEFRLKGDMYQEMVSELIHAIDSDKPTPSQSEGQQP